MTSKTYISDIKTLLNSLTLAKKKNNFRLYTQLLYMIREDTYNFISQLEKECILK